MKHKKLNIFLIFSNIIIAIILIPVIDIVRELLSKPSENWEHIKEYLLLDYISDTILVTLPSMVLALIIGVSLAWFVSVYDFPFRNLLKWGLVLPLAIPPYIGAYTYSGIVSYTGFIQTFFRNNLNIQVDPKFFDIFSINGSVFIFTIFLYPYIYMIVRSYISNNSASIIENARVLGEKGTGIFFRIFLPISRGAIVAGISLVMLEILSDYGVVSYFGVQTFSSAIFSSWFNFSDTNSAVRLSGILLLVVFLIITSEKLLRGNKKFSQTNSKIRQIKRKKLGAKFSFFIYFFGLSIFFLGFILPVGQLIYWAFLSYKDVLNIDFLKLIFNSIFIATVSTIFIIIASLIIGNFTRLSKNMTSKLYSKITLMGYSIPGAIISITVVLFFVDLDKILNFITRYIGIQNINFTFSLSIYMLIFGYFIRFLGVGYQAVESGYEKNGNKFYEASKTLGKNDIKTFFLVDIPMLKTAIIASFALVFVDIIKELPLALILRPFNFNTLATKVFNYANDEMIIEASIPSLFIIFVTIIAIVFLNNIGRKNKKDVYENK